MSGFQAENVTQKAINSFTYNRMTGEIVSLPSPETANLTTLAGTPESIGDKAPTSDKVKVVGKDSRGGKYFVYDKQGNTYEVDKKTYNALKKGKGTLSMSDLRPVDANEPQPMKKGKAAPKPETTPLTKSQQKAQVIEELNKKNAELHKAVTETNEAVSEQQKALNKVLESKNKAELAKNQKELNAATGKVKRQRMKVDKKIRDFKNSREIVKRMRDGEKLSSVLRPEVQAERLEQAKNAPKTSNRYPATGKGPSYTMPASEAAKLTPNAPTDKTPIGRKAYLDAKQGGSGLPKQPTVPTPETVVPNKPVVPTPETIMPNKPVAPTPEPVTPNKPVGKTPKPKIGGGGKWGKIIGAVVTAAVITATVIGLVNNDKKDSNQMQDAATTANPTMPNEPVATTEPVVPNEPDLATAPVTSNEQPISQAPIKANNPPVEPVPAEKEPSPVKGEPSDAVDLPSDEELDNMEKTEPVTPDVGSATAEVRPGCGIWGIIEKDIATEENPHPKNEEVADALVKYFEGFGFAPEIVGYPSFYVKLN